MVKNPEKTFLKSLTIISIRRATTLGVALSQKTSENLNDLHVGDY